MKKLNEKVAIVTGVPEEVAALVFWLSSDMSSYCTGGFYPVDCGALAL